MAARRNLFLDPRRLPVITPSVLSADFARLGEDCEHVLRPAAEGGAGADGLHIDVMDGHFVPNLTVGPALVRSLRRRLPEAFFDVHVMVTDPIQYVEPFAEAGADHLSFHLEPAVDHGAGAGMAPLSEGYDVRQVAQRVHEAGMSAGLVINPDTPVDGAIEVADAFDLILVMSVHPGFSGQAFIEASLEKTRAVRIAVGPAKRIQMDGGVSSKNAGNVRVSGCDVMVAGDAIFGALPGSRAGIVAELRGC